MKQFLIYCACAAIVALAAMYVANQVAPPTWAEDDQPEIVDEMKVADEIEIAPEVETVSETVEETDLECLAKMVWGEARGCSTKEQAACVWVVLNRVEDRRFPDSIQAVVKQKGQFAGYAGDNPCTSEIVSLCADVLARWMIEPELIGGVGRTIPNDYFFWWGDGKTNHFTKEWKDTAEWDWTLPNPYEVSK